MRRQPRRFGRAFEFRRHNQEAFALRVAQTWSEARPQAPEFDGALGFSALDLANADIRARKAAGIPVTEP